MKVPRKRGRVRWKTRPFPCSFAWSKTAVTVPPHSRTDRPATGPGHRSETRHPLRDHHAHISSPLALQTDTVSRQAKLYSRHQIRDDAQELALLDRTAPQFEVHVDMFRDGSGGAETMDIVRPGIDRLFKRLDIAPVAQRLNAAGRRAGSDRDQHLRLLSHGRECDVHPLPW